MSKTVYYEVDLHHLPPLTEGQQAELQALSELPDSAIDYSDLPPTDDQVWQEARRNPLDHSTMTTVQVDSDIFAWLQSQGKDYPARMNAILRKAMQQSQLKPH